MLNKFIFKLKIVILAIMCLVLSSCSIGTTSSKSEVLYELIEDENGTYYVVSGFTGNDLVNVTIPDTYNGISVKEIADSAFINCDTLVSITIPNSITKIGWFAFYACHNLKEIELGENISIIGGYAFYACDKLEKILLPYSMNNICTNAFGICTNLEEINIPINVNHVADFAFKDCHNLTIYCEATSKPNTWNRLWNKDRCPVVWDYKK